MRYPLTDPRTRSCTYPTDLTKEGERKEKEEKKKSEKKVNGNPNPEYLLKVKGRGVYSFAATLTRLLCLPDTTTLILISTDAKSTSAKSTNAIINKCERKYSVSQCLHNRSVPYLHISVFQSNVRERGTYSNEQSVRCSHTHIYHLACIPSTIHLLSLPILILIIMEIQ
jgi:hypothetical protein